MSSLTQFSQRQISNPLLSSQFTRELFRIWRFPFTPQQAKHDKNIEKAHTIHTKAPREAPLIQTIIVSSSVE